MKTNPLLEKMIAEARAEGRILSDYGCRDDLPPTTDALNRKALVGLLAKLIRASTSEAQFQGHFMGLASACGWKVVHFRKVLVKMGERCHYETPFLGDGKGEFDQQLLRDCLLKVELKFGKNKPTPEQLVRLEDYKMAGVEAYVWWPEDVDEIVQRLSAPVTDRSRGTPRPRPS